MPTNHKIMVVDDEPDLLRMIVINLQKCGFEAETFTNPLIAFEYFKKDTVGFSLVMIDMRMPRMSGIELTEKILQLNPKIKIMIITAYEIDSMSLQQGLPTIRQEDILKKPFLFNEICTGVRKMLQVCH
jgi:two-component system, cell cycle response regulator CpdR